ncbi:hypothetical protein HK098_005707 [Nowakowskiella sp. JEL0407]|nr:hypothetical protein HK098_005707 [Nowakowskiella sp. JEL0407]
MSLTIPLDGPKKRTASASEERGEDSDQEDLPENQTKKIKKSEPKEVQPYGNFPIARIKRIMREDRDIHSVSSDATFLVGAAAEKFIVMLATKAFKHTTREKRKQLMYKDLARTVSEDDQLFFLEDVVPAQIPYKKAIQRKPPGSASKNQEVMETNEDPEPEAVEEEVLEDEEEVNQEDNDMMAEEE